MNTHFGLEEAIFSCHRGFWRLTLEPLIFTVEIGKFTLEPRRLTLKTWRQILGM
jgi:hypothetical protein